MGDHGGMTVERKSRFMCKSVGVWNVMCKSMGV